MFNPLDIAGPVPSLGLASRHTEQPVQFGGSSSPLFRVVNAAPVIATRAETARLDKSVAFKRPQAG